MPDTIIKTARVRGGTVLHTPESKEEESKMSKKPPKKTATKPARLSKSARAAELFHRIQSESPYGKSDTPHDLIVVSNTVIESELRRASAVLNDTRPAPYCTEADAGWGTLYSLLTEAASRLRTTALTPEIEQRIANALDRLPKILANSTPLQDGVNQTLRLDKLADALVQMCTRVHAVARDYENLLAQREKWRSGQAAINAVKKLLKEAEAEQPSTIGLLKAELTAAHAEADKWRRLIGPVRDEAAKWRAIIAATADIYSVRSLESSEVRYIVRTGSGAHPKGISFMLRPDGAWVKVEDVGAAGDCWYPTEAEALSALRRSVAPDEPACAARIESNHNG